METPFIPTAGSTVNVAVTASAQDLTLPGCPSGGEFAFLLTNIGTQTVFVRLDGVTATVGNGIPVLANSQVSIGARGNASSSRAISAIAAGTGSTLYATLGQGS